MHNVTALTRGAIFKRLRSIPATVFVNRRAEDSEYLALPNITDNTWSITVSENLHLDVVLAVNLLLVTIDRANAFAKGPQDIERFICRRPRDFGSPSPSGGRRAQD